MNCSNSRDVLSVLNLARPDLLRAAAYIGATEDSPATESSIDATEGDRIAGVLRKLAQGSLTDAARDVLAERQRQIEKEGWTPEHDSDHNPGDLAAATACYATGVPDAHTLQFSNGNEVWPWAPEEFKPKDARRSFIVAGALILAEIERLDRQAAAKAQS